MRRRGNLGRFLRRKHRLNRRLVGPVERQIVRRSARRLWIGNFAAILLYGETAVKLRQEDLGRIEREMGKQTIELSEQDLAAAMDRLGIERLELTKEDLILIEKTEDPKSIPTHCPGCGAPLNPGNLRWHDPSTGECLYCGNAIRVE